MATFHLRRVVVVVLGVIVLASLGAAADLPAASDEGVTRFERDEQGRLILKRLPTGRAVRYRYDPAGLTARVSHHRVGRLTGWTYPFAGGVDYTYDAAGNRTAMEDASGETRYAYDDFNRLTSVTDPGGRALGYEYDAWNRVSALLLPNGARLAYRYDILNRVTRIDSPAGAVEYRYEPGRVTRRFPNGITSAFLYGESGSIAGIHHIDANGQPIATFRYMHDASGRIASIDENNGAASAARYAYDRIGRLVSVRDAQG